jgi:putative membrane protein
LQNDPDGLVSSSGRWNKPGPTVFLLPIASSIHTISGVFMKVSALVFAGTMLVATVASAQGVTDPQIAKIVVTANQVDIDAGKLAVSKATNPEVKKFAQTMVNDHTGVNKQAVALVTKLKVTPADNDTAKSLYDGGKSNVTNLQGLKGKDFDKAYIDHEVAYHTAVIDAVDKTLIPGAQNAELKALLVKVRPAFVAHLEHAKMIQASLSK